jgi:hypothetical protein
LLAWFPRSLPCSPRADYQQFTHEQIDWLKNLAEANKLYMTVGTDYHNSPIDFKDEEYDRLTIIDPHIKKEAIGDKYGILNRCKTPNAKSLRAL